VNTDKPLTRRARQRLETRQRIIEAAIAAFAERGFHGASTREIAGRCGVTQGLVTYHYKNKDNLWRAAAEHLFRGVLDRVQRSIADERPDDPRALARAAIRHYALYVAEKPELMRFMVHEGSVDEERVQWLVDTHVAGMYQTFGGIMNAAGVASDAMPLEHLYYVIAGASSLMFAMPSLCRRVTGLDPTDRAVMARHADIVARLLVPEVD